MRRLMALMFGVVIGAATVYTAFQYHVVRSDQRVLLVPKQRADWHEAYVDIRPWTFREWDEHPVFAQNMVVSGHGDLVIRSATDGLFRGFFDSFRDRGSALPSPPQAPSR
jgi:hypothetical protein